MSQITFTFFDDIFREKKNNFVEHTNFLQATSLSINVTEKVVKISDK